MANLKELRTRISSVKTTMQMTSAMKMVAAAKLRKAQQAVIQIRPYAEKIHSVLSDLVLAKSGYIENSFFENRKEKNVLLIVITSNRGLCGAFNSNVEKKTVQTIEKYKSQGIAKENIFIYAFGKRGAESLSRKKLNIYKKDIEVFDNLNFEYATKISEELVDLYNSNKYDKIEIIYNSFKNAATQILLNEQFLPVILPEDTKFKGDFIYEPDFNKVLEKLIPQTLTMQIYKALLDSYASENGARMTAMHKATDNATDLIQDLTLVYNKARQASITKEILEIVGGAEAMNG